jgi:hypothetical protein
MGAHNGLTGMGVLCREKGGERVPPMKSFALFLLSKPQTESSLTRFIEAATSRITASIAFVLIGLSH